MEGLPQVNPDIPRLVKGPLRSGHWGQTDQGHYLRRSTISDTAVYRELQNCRRTLASLVASPGRRTTFSTQHYQAPLSYRGNRSKGNLSTGWYQWTAV